MSLLSLPAWKLRSEASEGSWAWRRLITINRSLTLKSRLYCSIEHAVWSPIAYVFGVIVVFRIVEKTHVLMMSTPNLSVDSILRFSLVMLQYVEQVYQIYWYLIGMFIGRFVQNNVGIESIRGYDSSRMKDVYWWT